MVAKTQGWDPHISVDQEAVSSGDTQGLATALKVVPIPWPTERAFQRPTTSQMAPLAEDKMFEHTSLSATLHSNNKFLTLWEAERRASQRKGLCLVTSGVIIAGEEYWEPTARLHSVGLQ